MKVCACVRVQLVVAGVRLSEPVTVTQVDVHLGGVDVLVRFQTERQQLPDRHAERPLHTIN